MTESEKEYRRYEVPKTPKGGFSVSDWRIVRPELDEQTCIRCGICRDACPELAISMEEGEIPKFDMRYCKGCGVCPNECPVDAIEMVEE